MTHNESIQEFRIGVPQAQLDDLAQRLAAARWPDELPGVGWDYGVAASHLGELAGYWRDGFDWRAREARLNAHPQFTTTIDGQRIHFVHARSPHPGAIPLLITHGWPSTFADFTELLGPLTDPVAHGAPGAAAFHVITPSVPGFGFSGPTNEPGWDVHRIALAWAELMRRLGYDRYLVQGGDYGSLISPEVARVDPGHVAGVHLNGPLTLASIDWTSDDPLAGLTVEEAKKVYAAGAQWKERSGYATIQATRPQTLAYALSDSPLGLLAWDLEWFVDYDPAREIQTPIDRDAILTDVTITWLTGTAGSSARLYRESAADFAAQPSSGVPTGIAVFPGDATTRTLAERAHRVIHWSEYDRGGHFASLQAADLLMADIRAFSAALER